MGWCHKPGCHQELQVDSWVTVRLPLPLIGTQEGYNMLHLDIFGGLYNIYIYIIPLVCLLTKLDMWCYKMPPSKYLLINAKKTKYERIYLCLVIFSVARLFIKIRPSCMDDRLCTSPPAR